MDRQTIVDKLRTVFETVMDVEVKLAPSLTAKEVPEWDSLSHVRLMITVEREFKVRFSAVEIGELKNVGDLIALVEKHVNKG